MTVRLHGHENDGKTAIPAHFSTEPHARVQQPDRPYPGVSPAGKRLLRDAPVVLKSGGSRRAATPVPASRYAETRHVGHGKTDHFQAVFRPCHVRTRFVGGNIGRDQVEGIHVKPPADIPCGLQMAVVDGIEGSAQHPDAPDGFDCRFHNWIPCTLPGNPSSLLHLHARTWPLP